MQRHLTTATTSNVTKIITLMVAGLVGVAALVALLFISPASTDQSEAEDETAVEEATGPSEAEVAAAHQEAEATITSANDVLATAASKVDTTALEASVTQLADYKALSLDHVVALTDQTRTTAQQTAEAAAAAEALSLIHI